MYQRLFHGMLEAFALHEVVVDADGEPFDYLFIDVNLEFERMTGIPRDRLVGRTVLEVFPDIEPGWLRRYGAVASTGESLRFETYSSDLGKYLEIGVFRLEENRLAAFFLDATERRRSADALMQSEKRQKHLIATLERSESALAALVDEKNALLKEVHHRVKNNLQVIVSMMNIERGRLCAEGKADNALARMQDRILSMADVYDALYQSTTFSAADLGVAMQAIADRLSDEYDAQAKGIALTVRPGELFLPLDFAVPCCLVVSELVSNALLHAFPSDWQGPRTVELDMDISEAGRVVVGVRDSGIGLPPDSAGGSAEENASDDSPEMGGLRLARLLADQLDGELSIASVNGTSIRLTFPLP